VTKKVKQTLGGMKGIERKRNMFEEMVNELPRILSEIVDEIVREESGLIASEQIYIGMQYINVGTGHNH